MNVLQGVARSPISGRPANRIFGLAGWSGSGKTTLIRHLIPEFRQRGLRVSTVKHAHSGFDLDREGKDSWVHRQSGACEVAISSSARWAIMHELRGDTEPGLEELIRRMTPVDLILVEGFKRYPHPKIEVHRPCTGKPLLCADDPSILAVATDRPVAGVTVPQLDLSSAAEIADFILRAAKLGAA